MQMFCVFVLLIITTVQHGKTQDFFFASFQDQDRNNFIQLGRAAQARAQGFNVLNGDSESERAFKRFMAQVIEECQRNHLDTNSCDSIQRDLMQNLHTMKSMARGRNEAFNKIYDVETERRSFTHNIPVTIEPNNNPIDFDDDSDRTSYGGFSTRTNDDELGDRTDTKPRYPNTSNDVHNRQTNDQSINSNTGSPNTNFKVNKGTNIYNGSNATRSHDPNNTYVRTNGHTLHKTNSTRLKENGYISNSGRDYPTQNNALGKKHNASLAKPTETPIKVTETTTKVNINIKNNTQPNYNIELQPNVSGKNHRKPTNKSTIDENSAKNVTDAVGDITVKETTRNFLGKNNRKPTNKSTINEKSAENVTDAVGDITVEETNRNFSGNNNDNQTNQSMVEEKLVKNATSVEDNINGNETTTDYTLVIIGVTVGVVLFCVLIIIGIHCIKSKEKKLISSTAYDNNVAVFDVSQETEAFSESHVYESIPDFRNPGIDNTAIGNQRKTNFTQPATEDIPEYHYDNPYEFITFHKQKPDTYEPMPR